MISEDGMECAVCVCSGQTRRSPEGPLHPQLLSCTLPTERYSVLEPYGIWPPDFLLLSLKLRWFRTLPWPMVVSCFTMGQCFIETAVIWDTDLPVTVCCTMGQCFIETAVIWDTAFTNVGMLYHGTVFHWNSSDLGHCLTSGRMFYHGTVFYWSSGSFCSVWNCSYRCNGLPEMSYYHMRDWTNIRSYHTYPLHSHSVVRFLLLWQFHIEVLPKSWFVFLLFLFSDHCERAARVENPSLHL